MTYPNLSVATLVGRFVRCLKDIGLAWIPLTLYARNNVIARANIVATLQRLNIGPAIFEAVFETRAIWLGLNNDGFLPSFGHVASPPLNAWPGSTSCGI